MDTVEDALNCVDFINYLFSDSWEEGAVRKEHAEDMVTVPRDLLDSLVNVVVRGFQLSQAGNTLALKLDAVLKKERDLGERIDESE